ncbi:MAG: dihydroorotase [Saprospiraceae bacterium]|uniref:Dihydroorotase n=1 Tax=Candidatus Opimibacter skivensis TaxID=2982028 RepID=A0A9D7SQF2_9BACT|nr:dihydroorotase [Candidatus Opimibacter skivensis]
MKDIVFKEARIINRGKITEGDLWVRNDRIERIDPSIQLKGKVTEVSVNGRHLMPGVIDDQVHFREPGLEHKATIYSESRAGIAGGVTTFMEMPNTRPPALTQELLEDKYRIASTNAWGNYSFFMGTSNDNLDEILKTDPTKVCGVKVFMGSSTGNMLVDNLTVLEKLFESCPTLIATHCEDEATVQANLEEAKSRYGNQIPPSAHAWIRSREACYLSSSLAIDLAKRYNTRLHILHITTKEEIELFTKGNVQDKRITAEACVHHMYYSEQDYIELGNLIKCNPSIKTSEDRAAILKAVLDDRIDIIASDHAPHTWEEKSEPYLQAPSGLPLIQHSLLMMLSHWRDGNISLEKIVEKMCHTPALCFRVTDRGYLDEGTYADIVMLDTKKETLISKENILYKCAWSPLEGKTLPGKIEGTWVNGTLVYDNGVVVGQPSGKRLSFNY